jgi:hypothetical protein
VQRLVQLGPRRRKVAVPRLKHSIWLGQWASSQTVWSPLPLTAATTVALRPGAGILRLSHEGFSIETAIKYTTSRN